LSSYDKIKNKEKARHVVGLDGSVAVKGTVES